MSAQAVRASESTSRNGARASMRKEKVGRVVSDKMDKTIVVSVERLSRHPLYKRVIRLTTKFKAHDERNEARIGDTVRIVVRGVALISCLLYRSPRRPGCVVPAPAWAP